MHTRMAEETSRISSVGAVGNNNNSSGGMGMVSGVTSWPPETCSTTLSSEQTSAPGLDNAVAVTELQNVAGEVVVAALQQQQQSPAACGQAVAGAAAEANRVTPVARAQGAAAHITSGAFTIAEGDDRDDVCMAGRRHSELVDGGCCGTPTAAGETEMRTVSSSSLEPGNATLGSADAAVVATAAGDYDGTPSTAAANVLCSSCVSGAASATLVKRRRTYSSCEEYGMDPDKLINTEGLVDVEQTRATGEFAEEWSMFAVQTEITRAETTYDSCTNSSAGDCYGCVVQTTETGGGDAAGVPPYLRIETLPCAMLDEGSGGGHSCVLLGEKKEALLYSVATPFGVNRWLLVCVYMLYAFLTGCVYFGWPSMSYMLLTSGAYSWRCPRDSNGEFINDLRRSPNSSNSSSDSRSSDSINSGADGGGDDEKKYYICDEQDAAVGPLFTIAYVTQSLMSVVAGTLLDHVSPKHAAVLGQLLNAVGWVLLACSSYSFQAYIPAMVFIGLGADTAYLPTLLIAALFPGKRATVITMLGSANTASFAVPMLLELIWKSYPEWKFSTICWLYLGMGPLFCCCLAALFIPRSSFGSAALRKLPLQQQQQSPLHGRKGDAQGDALLLTTTEETAEKKRPWWKPQRRHNKIYCCCFGSSDKRQQQERKLFQRWDKHAGMSSSTTRGGVYCCGCCSSCCFSDVVQQPREISRTTAFTRERQRLSRVLRSIVLRGSNLLFFGVSRVLQQRLSTLRLWWCSRTKPITEQQQQQSDDTLEVVVPQEQQPTLLIRLDSQQSQPSNTCFWSGGDGGGDSSSSSSSNSGWLGNNTEGNTTTGGDAFIPTTLIEAEGSAAEADKVLVVVAELPTVTSDTAAGGVDVKVNASERRSADDVETAVFEYDVEEGITAAVATEKDSFCKLCVTGRCGADKGPGNWRSSIQEDKDCRCVNMHFTATHESDNSTSSALHGQIPTSSYFFTPFFNGNEGETEAVPNPHHCKSCMCSRTAAAEENIIEATGRGGGGGGEKDVEDALAVTAPASSAVVVPAATTRHASADTVEVEDDEEPSFCSQLLSSHFMCIVLYWSGMAVAISYFQSTASRLLSTKALGFMDVALSFSFIPCVMLGKMIDVFGPFPALFLVNTMGVLTYCCALVGGSQQQGVMQYVSILAFCVYVSVDSEQVFCYVENTFNAKHFGKLSGLALTTGGVISLVSIPLYEEVTMRLLHKNPLPVCCGLMVVLIFLYFTLGSMWFVRSKHPPSFKAKKKHQLVTPDSADADAATDADAAAAAAEAEAEAEAAAAASSTHASGERANAYAAPCGCVAVAEADLELGEAIKDAYAYDDEGSTGLVGELCGSTPGKQNHCCCCGSRESSTMSNKSTNVKVQERVTDIETGQVVLQA